MKISINLDEEKPIDFQAIKSILYLTSIVFQLTVDLHLDQKIAKISPLVQYLAQHPVIKTTLKVKSIQQNPIKQYKVTAVGGTFDYLHIGHQILLLYTVLAAKEAMYIGVAGKGLLTNKKYKELIQPLNLRIKNVRNFLTFVDQKLELIIFELNDPFGPTISQQRIQCLVASPETSSALQKINQLRKERNLKEIDLIQCPLLSPNNQIGTKISTTLIKKQLWLKNQLTHQQYKQYKSFFTQLLTLLNSLRQQKDEKIDQADFWWNYIFFSYSQPWRFYHTNRHIYQLFKWWSSHQFQKQKESLTLIQRASIQLTLFFHDIIYRPGNLHNQKQSADLCQAFLKDYLQGASLSEHIISQARRLILETQTHSKPKCFLSQIIYDLDMGILNDPTQYKKYAVNVRKEYWPLFGDQFSEKRSEFLKKTLKEGLHFSFEAINVQKNLIWELEALQSGQL